MRKILQVKKPGYPKWEARASANANQVRFAESLWGKTSASRMNTTTICIGTLAATALGGAMLLDDRAFSTRPIDNEALNSIPQLCRQWHESSLQALAAFDASHPSYETLQRAHLLLRRAQFNCSSGRTMAACLDYQTIEIGAPFIKPAKPERIGMVCKLGGSSVPAL